MFYRAKIEKSARMWLVTFPDCEGCFTQGASRAEAVENAEEALAGWLETVHAQGGSAPKPRARQGQPIAVSPRLAFVLQMRARRLELRLTQADLAERLGATQQHVAKLERPGSKTIETMMAIAYALDKRLEIKFV